MEEGKSRNVKKANGMYTCFIMLDCKAHTYLASQEFQLHFPEPHLEWLNRTKPPSKFYASFTTETSFFSKNKTKVQYSTDKSINLFFKTHKQILVTTLNKATKHQILQQTLNLLIPRYYPWFHVYFSSINVGNFLKRYDCLLYRLQPSTGTGGSTCGIQQIQQEWAFVTLFNPDHLLGNVLWGGAYTAHSQEDILLQEVTGQDLQMTRTVLTAANKANDVNKQKEEWKHTWISLGKVALNIMVWRAPLGGIVSCSTIRLICGSKPMSSIRSASSKTR